MAGLTKEEAAAKLAANGPNAVAEPTFSFPRAVLKRLWEPSAWILEVALVLEIAMGKGLQAGFIVLMLLFAAVNGAIQERRASTVLHQLSHQLVPTVAVQRSGTWLQRPARELVVGDLISLRQGSIVPADAVVNDAPLEVDESSISGETQAVAKPIGATIFAGTTIVQGHALATVSATGAASRSGKTLTLLNQASAPGHLQQLLGRIIKYLAVLDSVLALIIVAAALIRGEDLIGMVPFLAMLFIATIPIAMPSSFAVANSVEAKALSDRHILVSDLVGIQEAATLDVLLVDKTGTLTQNRPTVVAFKNLSALPDATVATAAALATDRQAPSVIDAALLAYAEAPDWASRTGFTPFDSQTGFSQATATLNGKKVTLRLGAVAILQARDAAHPLLPHLDLTAGRSVAVSADDSLLGVFVLQDTLRPDSREAVAALQARGIRVIELSGDNLQTAGAIAEQVGLTGDVLTFDEIDATTDLMALAGIAEVRPEDKLAIVRQLQHAGHRVGMTGDGVNDAPALHQAEVGIAVDNAVDLAKRAAKLVLMTPGLTPIVEILDSGHRVYQRMMTWTITKLSRTAELTLLLTLGYLIYGKVPLALNAMILVAILNDLVTLALGTDHTTITHRPERWAMGKLAVLAGVLALGWTAVGMALMARLQAADVAAGALSTQLFCYLIFSAMLTILITRSQRLVPTTRPSRGVTLAVSLNVVLTVALALTGLGVAALTWPPILVVAGLTLITGLALAVVYQLVLRLANQA